MFLMDSEEKAISEAEKAVNRKIVEQKMADAKRFFASAVYKQVVWNEEDEIEGYEEDYLSY